jgi:hypothetical protein
MLHQTIGLRHRLFLGDDVHDLEGQTSRSAPYTCVGPASVPHLKLFVPTPVDWQASRSKWVKTKGRTPAGSALASYWSR